MGATVGYGRFRNGDIASFGLSGDGSTRFKLDDGIRIGFRMAFDLQAYFAHEVSYAWQSAAFRTITVTDGGASTRDEKSNASIHNYYYNFVAHATRRDSRIRPFVTGGGGLSSFVPPGASALSGQGDTKFGYNYGAGIKFLLSDKYGLRFDVRDHVTGKPFFQNVDGRLHNVETSATFSFLF